jgi:hypothetical protein
LFNNDKLLEHRKYSFLENKINEDFYDIKVEHIFNKNISKVLRSYNIATGKDLEKKLNVRFDYINFFEQIRNPDDFFQVINYMSAPLHFYIKKRMKKLIESDGFKIYYDNLVNEKPLIDIANEKFKSRESIRRKKEEVMLKLYNFLKLHEDYLETKNLEKPLFVKEDIFFNVLKDKNLIKIFQDVLKNFSIKNFHWLENYKVFAYGPNPNKYEKEFEDLLRNLDDIFDIEIEEDYLSYLYEKISFTNFDKECLREFLLKNGYKEGMNVFYKDKVLKHQMYSFLVEKCFMFGIKNQRNDLERLKYLYSIIVENVVDEKIDTTWKTILKDVENIVSWKDNSLIHKNNIYINKKTKEKIENFINELLEKNNRDYTFGYITAKDVYNYIEKDLELEESNVDSEDLLFNYLKVYLKNKFSFKNKKIVYNDQPVRTDVEILDAFVKDEGKIITLEYGQYILNWSIKKFHSVVSESNKVIFWDNNQILTYVDMIDLGAEDIKFIKKLIEDSLINQYTNRYILFNNGKDKLKKIGIEDDRSLYNIVNHFFKEEYEFARGVHISKKRTDNEHVNFYKLFKNLFKKEIILSEKYAKKIFTDKYMLPIETTNSFFSIYKKILVKVNKSGYCLKEDLKIKKSLIRKIDEYLNEKLKFEPYVSVKEMIERRFPEAYVKVQDLEIFLNQHIFFHIKQENFFNKYYILDCSKNDCPYIIRYEHYKKKIEKT